MLSPPGFLPMSLTMHSFDVFDTVLTRTVGGEMRVHDLAARELCAHAALPVDPATVVAARRSAEQRLFSLRGRPPKLAEVHAEVAVALGLHPSSAKELEAAELRWERRVSVAVPGIDEVLRRARSSGRVVFSADTPHSEAFVRELLQGAGAWEEGDAVYTSADRGASKQRGGGLFAAVLDDLGIAPGGLVHVGDGRFGDVAEPRLRGIRAVHAPTSALNRYERILEDAVLASDGFSSHLAGASRLARLRAALDGVDPDLAAVATGVAAPLLVGFGLWVLRQAREQHLDRLCFVARDGEVMLEVTRALAEAQGIDDVELRYLYGSRSAWHLASLHGRVDADLSYWLHGHAGEPAREVLDRVGLTPEAAFALVADPVLDPRHADETLSAAAAARLHALVEQPPLLAEVRRVAAERHVLLRDHLVQEGFADGARIGVVDVGWLGRSGRSLDGAMVAAGLPPVVTYLHMGLAPESSRWVSESLADRMRAFLFDHLHGSGVPGAPSGAIGLIEAFCTGSEGSVSGYRREGDRVVPTLVRPVHTEAVAWGLHDLRAGIAGVVAELVRSEAPLARPGDLRPAVDRCLRAFWEHPTSGEVAVWGRFPFEASHTHLTSAPLAAPVRTADVIRDLRHGRLRLRPATSWRAGTAAVSSSPWRHILRGWGWLDERRSRLRGVPRRVRLEVAARRREPDTGAAPTPRRGLRTGR